MSRYAALYARLGYVFSDEALLQHALTHRSYGPEHNERLEFLGDSLLNMIVTDVLFSRYPGLDEGELSRMRAALVSGKTLAQVATELQLGDSLRLGAGERNSGGHRRSSTLADAVEALLGAVYLEAGMQACRDCVMRWFASRLDQLDPTASHKDAKTRLQELLQARKQPLPDYQLCGTEGKAHQQAFTVSCVVSLLSDPVVATGTSRRKAEQAAAEAVLARLEK
ncbi:MULTISPECIES: ribonuclease III [Spongiibacter]|nr:MULTISPECIES: ribonuclease III [Spongiibacter]MAY40179.1 ribonuclease III [Spongiibacter sp.]MBI57953.1 ribonuclease III [Spongiibacter sp.]MBO6753982.1 ribonuclease III [Spongiibacter sp.]MBU73082.1 ribonuclease III [Spongiibacter sp.]|tara:strand:- start:11212 stop:11883 length:672 start_codon:yes stop_codon:yes gene_type:complete